MLAPLFSKALPSLAYICTDSLCFGCTQIRTRKETTAENASNVKAEVCLRVYLEFLSHWDKRNVGNPVFWCSPMIVGEPRAGACALLRLRPRDWFPPHAPHWLQLSHLL